MSKDKDRDHDKDKDKGHGHGYGHHQPAGPHPGKGVPHKTEAEGPHETDEADYDAPGIDPATGSTTPAHPGDPVTGTRAAVPPARVPAAPETFPDGSTEADLNFTRSDEDEDNPRPKSKPKGGK